MRKMVKPALKKEAAGYLQQQHGLSQRRAASLVGSAPKVLRYQSKRGEGHPDQGAYARSGSGATTLGLSSPASSVAARELCPQTQENTPALPPGEAASTAQKAAQKSQSRNVSNLDAHTPSSTLDGGLRPRHSSLWAGLSHAQRYRRRPAVWPWPLKPIQA